MDEDLELLREINNHSAYNQVVLKGTCSFCGDKVTFRQRSYDGLKASDIVKSVMIPVQCEGCHSLLIYSNNEKKLYPTPMLPCLNELPEEINQYYTEGVKCISADSPNGAVTLFRKVIHALGIHYGIAKKNDSKNLYTIVKELHEKGHIVKKIKDALLGVKDIGNDGAHINENEPDLEQAIKLKQLIDVVLNSTVLCDKHIDFVNSMHSK